MKGSYNIRTGKRSKTQAEYERVFEDLIKYEKNNLNSDDFKNITNQSKLNQWLLEIGSKGAETGRLADAISNTRLYDSLEENNKERIEKETKAEIEKVGKKKKVYVKTRRKTYYSRQTTNNLISLRDKYKTRLQRIQNEIKARKKKRR